MDFEQLGPYKIGPRLGKGGMGSVYRGVNIESGEMAAIKALAPQLATSEGFRERFEAEIESLKTLRHGGIVRLFGYGQDANTLFYAMELVEGRSLEEELKAGRRFNWREVVDITIQVCKALKHAHDHGIVHRDIKPANILLDQNEKVKLADFGIARLFGGTQLTMAGGVLGTADYMSPEQAEGRPVSDRCDQYSLGCVMYALLAGRPPFQAKSLPEMLQLQRFAEPEPVRRYAPHAPEQLEHTIMQLLSKNPDDRFPNTLVVARHLEAMRRALSRPFDHSQPMPGGELDVESANNPAAETPLELAVTQSEDSDRLSDSTSDSDFALDDSVDLEAVPTSLREAATIDSEPTQPTPVPEATPAASAGHFTTVDVAGESRTARLPNLSVIAASLGLLALVAAFGFFIYHLTRPYDADTLYAIIHDGADSLSLEELRPNAERIEEFLQRYPDDPRAEQMREYVEQLELDRMERRFATLARGRGDEEELLTAERLYLDALRRVELEPEAAAAQLDDLIELFDVAMPETTASPSEQRRLEACLELAKRQRRRLDERLESQLQSDLATLESRLELAQSLEPSAPEKAIAICEAIVSLYGSKAWAEDVVERAKKLKNEWAADTTTGTDNEDE